MGNRLPGKPLFRRGEGLGLAREAGPEAPYPGRRAHPVPGSGGWGLRFKGMEAAR